MRAARFLGPATLHREPAPTSLETLRETLRRLSNAAPGGRLG